MPAEDEGSLDSRAMAAVAVMGSVVSVLAVGTPLAWGEFIMGDVEDNNGFGLDTSKMGDFAPGARYKGVFGRPDWVLAIKQSYDDTLPCLTSDVGVLLPGLPSTIPYSGVIIPEISDTGVLDAS